MVDYTLKEKRKVDDMIDYIVWLGKEEIAVLNINHNENGIFIRQIKVYEDKRRKGHAKNIVKFLLNEYKLPVTFCVATNSKSAISFWADFLKTHKNNHIRGEIYELIP